MKKLLLLILICFIQNISAQSSTKTTATKNNNSKLEETTKQDPTAKNKVYNMDSVEIKPTFEGGIQKFQKFIRNNFFYHDEKDHVKGIVDVNFIVEKDGTLSNIKVTKDVGYGTGNEAIRILKKSPKWIPATHDHRLVRSLYYLSIPVDNRQE